MQPVSQHIFRMSAQNAEQTNDNPDQDHTNSLNLLFLCVIRSVNPLRNPRTKIPIEKSMLELVIAQFP